MQKEGWDLVVKASDRGGRESHGRSHPRCTDFVPSTSFPDRRDRRWKQKGIVLGGGSQQNVN